MVITKQPPRPSMSIQTPGATNVAALIQGRQSFSLEAIPRYSTSMMLGRSLRGATIDEQIAPDHSDHVPSHSGTWPPGRNPPIMSEYLTLSKMYTKRDESLTSDELARSIMMNDDARVGTPPPIQHASRESLQVPRNIQRKPLQPTVPDFTNSTIV